MPRLIKIYIEGIKIPNPFKIVEYKYSWSVIKNHVYRVANLLPEEWKIVAVNNESESIIILQAKLQYLHVYSLNDLPLFISNILESNSKATIMYSGSNEHNSLEYFNEQKRLLQQVDIFVSLMNLSLNGTLEKILPQKENREHPIQTRNAIVRAVCLIVILACIIMGLNA